MSARCQVSNANTIYPAVYISEAQIKKLKNALQNDNDDSWISNKSKCCSTKHLFHFLLFHDEIFLHIMFYVYEALQFTFHCANLCCKMTIKDLDCDLSGCRVNASFVLLPMLILFF